MNLIEINYDLKESNRVIRYESSHYSNIGEYSLDRNTYINENINRWAKGMFEYVMAWCDVNYPDASLFYRCVWDNESMGFIVAWFFKFPSIESKIHFILSDVRQGGGWF